MRSEEDLLLSAGFEAHLVAQDPAHLGERRQRRSGFLPQGMRERRRRRPSRKPVLGLTLLALLLHALPVLAVACLGGLELLGTSSEGGSGWAQVTWVPVEGEPGQAPGIAAVPEAVPAAAAPALPELPQMASLDAGSPEPSPDLAPSRPALPAGAGSGGPVAGEGESLGSAGELEAPVWNPRPAYPTLARKAGLEGCVEIALEVAPDGRVTGSRILSSSGHEILDLAALAALSRWRFAPRRGASVKTFHQEVVFRLENPGFAFRVQN